VHDGPEPFGQPGRHDAGGFEVLGAAFDHLLVVDPGRLGVLFAGPGRRARIRVTRASREPALDIGWPLRSVLPVSEARGVRP